MSVHCIKCCDYQFKLNSRDEQIRFMVTSFQRILVAANDAVQGKSRHSDREVLLAIASEAAKF